MSAPRMFPVPEWFEVRVVAADYELDYFPRESSGGRIRPAPDRWTTSALSRDWPPTPRQMARLAESWYEECGLYGSAWVTLEAVFPGCDKWAPGRSAWSVGRRIDATPIGLDWADEAAGERVEGGIGTGGGGDA